MRRRRAIPTAGLALLALAPRAAPAAIVTVTDCTVDSNGPGQLRTLVNAASPGDTILLPPCVVTLTQGALAIATHLALEGSGAARTAISGNHADRVLDVAGGATVTVADLTIRDGKLTGAAAGAGIRSAATLTLRGVTVTGNDTADQAGGILSDGPLILIDSTVSDNTSVGAAAGIGIGSSGSLTLIRSTVSGNRQTGPTQGGGGLVVNGTSLMVNSTVSGNTAAGPLGGGGVRTIGGVLTVLNSTIAGNRASAGPGGGVLGAGGTAALHNTLIAGNTATGGGANCSGSGLASAGHNLASDGSCPFTATGDRGDTDPRLGPLRDNGGATATHALLAGSLAIGGGDPAGCPNTDQRRMRREPGTGCDIGAFHNLRLGPRGGDRQPGKRAREAE